MSTKSAFVYLRTSSDDNNEKAGLPVQRAACLAYAERNDYAIAQEFSDDGVTGKLSMHARPQGKLLIAALLGDGVKTVLAYDAKRIGRTQPSFWSFIGLCRDNGITLLDAAGTDLTTSVMGGVHGLLSEMDRDATVARFAGGKLFWRDKKRVEGRWHYGEHPRVEFSHEREVVARIQALKLSGIGNCGIARALDAEGIRTRYAKVFTATTVRNILARVATQGRELK